MNVGIVVDVIIDREIRLILLIKVSSEANFVSRFIFFISVFRMKNYYFKYNVINSIFRHVMKGLLYNYKYLIKKVFRIK